MLIAAFTLALMATPQTVPAQTPTALGDPVTLEDVIVTGQPLESMIRNFVDEVAAPNRNRNLARWDGTICVGVTQLKREAAQYLVDRVSTVAEDLGQPIGGPGCSPNILIIATDDGDALAGTLVATRPRAFRMGGAGMDQGRAALSRFQQGARPVRWWQMAMPVNADTGQRAVRLPGDCQNACTEVTDAIPTVNVFAASRLNGQVVDNLFRTIIVVDVTRLQNVSILQLADYIAMVSLAQIDADADTSNYASILNVFQDPDSSESLTSWDLTYLAGLYDAQRGDRNPRSGHSAVAASIRRAHARLRADDGIDPR